MWQISGPNPRGLDLFRRACLGYANTPGWVFIRSEAQRQFGRLDGLRIIELGCGQGKVSFLFSALGAEVSLLDCNADTVAHAGQLHRGNGGKTKLIVNNLLDLPNEFRQHFDIAMSFGTVEHFFGDERQRAFDSHAEAIREGGLVVIWAPNRYGLFFHAGRLVRNVFGRLPEIVPETSFSRRELKARASAAGLHEIRIRGGEELGKDFFHFVLDVRRFLPGISVNHSFADTSEFRDTLRTTLLSNAKRIRPWNDYFSYPLVLVARK
jgi:2-polyprenyl-3-methyl-5-hydroxy-6-metoxy-1,4-benzoquinol methylase